MLQKLFFRKIFLQIFVSAGLILLTGCQDNSVNTTEDINSSEKQEIIKVINEDSLLTSFQPNYDEDGVLNYLQKTDAEIKPYKVWHKMKLVDRDIQVTFDEDTLYAHVTNTFDGTLFIISSYDPTSVKPDTLIKKQFTSVVTFNVVMVKIANKENQKRNWIIREISLAQGGTQSSNIKIKKVTITLPNGEILEINSPNDFYIARKWGWWRRCHNIPVIQREKEVKVTVEVTSAYEEKDYVSLTFGANQMDVHKNKKIFDLISSTPNGLFYDKIYEQTFAPKYFPGFFHAIINLMPQQVIKDDMTPVELESWGVPYFVKF